MVINKIFEFCFVRNLKQNSKNGEHKNCCVKSIKNTCMRFTANSFLLLTYKIYTDMYKQKRAVIFHFGKSELARFVLKNNTLSAITDTTEANANAIVNPNTGGERQNT